MKILIKHNDAQKGEQYRKLNAYGGCGYYRVIKVAEQLKKEHDVTVWGTEWKDKYEEFGDVEKFYNWIAEEFDVVWLHFIDDGRVFSYLKTALDRYGKKLVMDIDDNYLDVESTNPAYKYIKAGEEKRAELTTILSFCDALTVSTLPLKEKLFNHFKERFDIDMPIFVIPNYNDVKDWNFEPVKKGENGIVIGYMGGISHHGDLDMVLPAIKNVMKKYDNVGFQLIGQLTHEHAKKVFSGWSQKLRKRILLIQPSATFFDFPRWMSQMPWDIGIAPLTNSKFNQSKSHIKWMEYSMYEIPTVASKVYPYYKDILGIKTIEDGVTGLLCENGEWEEKLSLLIEDEILRKKIGKQAKEYVLKNWQYDDAKRILDVAREIESL